MASDLEILRGIRDFYVENPTRWFQGGFRNEDGTRLCPLGVYRHLFPEDYYRNDSSGDRIHKVLQIKHIAKWNDAPNRTFDQIIRRFDRAIARLEQENANAPR